MGQRHMTYVLTEGSLGDKDMLPLYNQWNYELIQPQKIIRFILALMKWKRNKVLARANELCKLYQYSASVHEFGLSSFTREVYEGSYCMHDEDNNNGWQIVYVKTLPDKKGFQLVVGFKPGGEWGGADVESIGYLSLKDYLDGYLKNNPPEEGSARNPTEQAKNFEEYVATFSKKEQKILHQINDSYSASVIEIARQEIEKTIQEDKVRAFAARARAVA